MMNHRTFHRIKNKLLPLLGLLFFYQAVQAQDETPYTLAEILHTALTNSNPVVQARYDYEEGAMKTKEVKASALPQINVNADLTDNVLTQAFVFPASFLDANASPDDYILLRAGLQYSSTVTAQATQQLFNQSVFTGIKAAKTSETYYQQNITAAEEQVMAQVSALFYQAASFQAQREILASNLTETEKNLKIVNDQYLNGLARKLDVDRLKVSVTNIQTQIRSVEDNYSNVLNQLKLAAGIDINTAITLDEPLVSDTTTYTYDPVMTGEDWQWENKIEFKQFNTQLDLYDLERKNFAAGYYPTLSAFANYTYTGQSNKFIFGSESNAIWYDIAAIGLRLNVPVFDGFSKSAQIQQSKIHRLKTEKNMQFTKQQLNMEYQNALNTFQTNYASYLAQKDNVALANNVYDVTLQNYNEGVSPLTDLLEAEASRTQAKSQMIESLLKVKQAEVTLLKAKGEIKNLLN